MPFTPKAPSVPHISTVWIDPKTGQLTREAHNFLTALLRWLEALRAAIP